jgi:uncharacterized glyoxalase superfamily protein PhnB
MAVSVIVFVEDVARSLAFYERVVGAELDHFDEDGSYGELKSGVGFDAVFARGLEAGATAVWEPREKPWGRSALVRDLDGVFVHLTQA